MKIFCTQENLNQGLMVVSHITGRNINLPILNNVLLKTEDKVIKLSTTDLELGINCTIRGKVDQEGGFTVQAKLLTNLIGLLPKEKIDLEVKNNELIIKTENSETKIKGLPNDEFPLIPQIDKNQSAVCKSNDFKKAVQQVIFTVAVNESRPEISGVLLKFNEELIITGTDSYRLAEKKIKLEKSNIKNKHLIIPIKTLQELLRVINEEGDLEICLSENQILFVYSNIEIISRIIDGQYPQYEQIIPQKHSTKVVIDNNKLIQVVKQASLFCQPGINNINLNFDAKKQELTTRVVNSQLGESVAKIKTEIEGEDNNIIFNYRYLLDGLLNLDSPEAVLKINNSDSPCLLTPLKEKDYLYIIMPIKQ